MAKRYKVFFGWYVIIAACVANLLVIGVMGNCSSNYVVPITDELSLSRTSYSFFALIYGISSGIFALYIFRIFKKYNYRKIIILSTTIFCISYMCFGLVNELWHIYLVSAISGFSSACIGGVVVSTMINNWFEDNKGIVLAIAFSSSGIGGAILNPVIANLVQTLGWRATYFYVGLGMLIISIPLIIPFYILTPEEKKQKPYKNKAENKDVAEIKDGVMLGITCKEALKTKEFWWISIAFTMIILSTMMIMLHYIPILISKGLSIEKYSLISSGMMLSIVLGKFILGYLLDKFKPKVGITLFLTFYIMSYTIMLTSSGVTALLISGILFGVALSVTTILPPHLIFQVFGKREYGIILARVNVIVLIGTCWGGVLSGILYDLVGDYSGAILVAMLLIIFALLILLFLNLVRNQSEEMTF